MDFLGIGILELLVILLVAVVVLGPAKTVQAAGSIGKMLGKVRSSMTDLSRAVEEEERDLDRSVKGTDRAEPDAPEKPEAPH